MGRFPGRAPLGPPRAEYVVAFPHGRGYLAEVPRLPPVMYEIEVYAQGLRQPGKIVELDRELEAVAGLRYKADANHDIVYLSFETPSMTVQDIRVVFRKLGLEPRIVGAIPPELQSRSKTQPLLS